jgi:hypothetical protein
MVAVRTRVQGPPQPFEAGEADRIAAPSQVFEVPERFAARLIDAAVHALDKIFIPIQPVTHVGIHGTTDGAATEREIRDISHLSTIDVARVVPLTLTWRSKS